MHKIAAGDWRTINAGPVQIVSDTIERETVHFNERQRQIINRKLEYDFKGHMNTSEYAKLEKCSNNTALRNIKEFLARKIFFKNAGGDRAQVIDCFLQMSCQHN